MRMGIWLVVAAMGFGGMWWAFSARARLDPHAPWASGVLVIGPKADAQSSRAMWALGGLNNWVNGKTDRKSDYYVAVESITVPALMLPAGARGEAILKGLAMTQAKLAASLEGQLRPKLLWWPMDQARIGATWLKSGRLPAPNTDEILGGSDAHAEGPIAIADHSLTVVGVLKPDLGLLANAFLIPKSARSQSLFQPDNPEIRQATLIAIPTGPLHKKYLLENFKTTFPAPEWTRTITDEQTPATTYGLYLLGMAMFLLGGTGVLFELYRWAAWKVRWRWLADPLIEIDRRPRLFWGVHLVYFGLVILGSIAIRGLPEVQAVMGGAIEAAFEEQGNPLAKAGEAYASGSVPRAAAVTFVVNFFLGSLAYLTLPALILPGAGALLGALRAGVWGVILAPTHMVMARMMIPHSGTLLLEGEAYILAVFFGLLVPIRIFQKSLGGDAMHRYGGAVVLNLKANILVAMVLGVAAWYEAFEVIAQFR